MRRSFCGILLAAAVLAFAAAAGAQSFDPTLSAKATGYTDWLIQWHSTGLGGVTDIIFTDATRTKILQTSDSGDSEDWTATYLVTQAIRYAVTGDPAARAEVLRIAHYLHICKDITGDSGYIARYAAPDEAPWNIETLGADNRYPGAGAYAGDFWLGQEVRDKYITWFWGLSWAYDAVDDPTMRATIRQDFRDVIATLHKNNWTIIDPWGNIYSGAQIMPDIRLSILMQAATVIDEPEFWTLLDDEYQKNQDVLWLSTIAFFNKYYQYYAFINNYSNSQPLFRWWPDRERLAHMFHIWDVNVRQWSNGGHNPFFDSVYYQACLRLGGCDAADLSAIKTDAYNSLTEMYDAPNWQRAKTCTQLPLDPFSVWAHQILVDYPWIEQLTGIDIEPQTLDPHEVWDRCWVSTLWESSPYHTSCTETDDPTHTTHGVDYLIAYWLGVYYGVLPGDGPYGDDELDDDNDNDASPAPDDDDNDDDDDDNDNDNDSGRVDDDQAPAKSSASPKAGGCGC
jgi:hypothetical protein